MIDRAELRTLLHTLLTEDLDTLAENSAWAIDSEHVLGTDGVDNNARLKVQIRLVLTPMLGGEALVEHELDHAHTVIIGDGSDDTGGIGDGCSA